MEKSFDFVALLKKNEKTHKNKPTQFVSVAGGVKKRLEGNLKYRKSNRFSIFDSIRNLPKCDSPVPLPPVSEAQMKLEHRRQQLEKWKKEKEKKKKEEAAQKKKPFLTGVPHGFPKLPPPPKPMPSTSGRVTRSQAAQNNQSKDKVDAKLKGNRSFAPKHASFKPPKEIKDLPKLPTFQKRSIKNDTICNFFDFNPVVPQVKQTRSKTRNKVELKPVELTKTNKRAPVKPELTKAIVASTITSSSGSNSTYQSASSSEMETIIEKDIPKNKSLWKTKPCTIPLKSCTSNSALQSTSSSEIEAISEAPKTRTPRKSRQRSSQNFTPKNLIPKSESSSEERLRSPKSPISSEDQENTSTISPCVTVSRGKDNARREMKKKIDEGLLDDDASDMESVAHFRRQLASEIERMTHMCNAWDKISEQTVLPETVQELVLTAVGQSRLLMSQKLQQFASLLDRCERPDPNHALVTPADLHGFWDMVFMQVENVDIRFKKLEELRTCNWVEDKPVEQKKKIPSKANAKKTSKPTGGPSRLREMIAAARKAKKQHEPSPNKLTPSKTFEAGFFCVHSPVRSPVISTPNKHNLLKAVLSSEAKKASASKNSASFAMLRASILGKNVDLDGVAPLEQTPKQAINFNATPGRSILKSGKKPSGKKSGKKSIKVVLFDHSDEEESFARDTTKIRPNEPAVDDNKTVDSAASFMDIEKDSVSKENKKTKRKSDLKRQDAVDVSPPMQTRSRRKSMQTFLQETIETKRSTRKKPLQEVSNVLTDQTIVTPKRSSRRRKSVQVVG